MARKKVKNKIREIRAGLGMTQQALANLVGVARVSILSIEKGHFLPTIETALQISKALGVPLEEIFWIEEEDT